MLLNTGLNKNVINAAGQDGYQNATQPNPIGWPPLPTDGKSHMGDRGLGVPAIKPYISVEKASVVTPSTIMKATYLEVDAKQWVDAHPGKGPVRSYNQTTVDKIEFMTSKEAGVKLKGVMTGLDDNAPVYLVIMHDDYTLPCTPQDPSQPVVQRTPQHHANAHMVFDAITGNLLLMGVDPN